jgi:hypothetical protein
MFLVFRNINSDNHSQVQSTDLGTEEGESKESKNVTLTREKIDDILSKKDIIEPQEEFELRKGYSVLLEQAFESEAPDYEVDYYVLEECSDDDAGDLLNHIISSVREKPNLKSKRIHQACMIFLEETIKFFKAKNEDGADQQQLTDLAQWIEISLIDQPTNIHSFTTTAERFIVASLATNSPELGKSFAITLMEKLVKWEKPEEDHEVQEQILEYLKHANTAQTLDFLHVLQTLAHIAASEQYQKRRGAINRMIQNITKGIISYHPNAFTRYAALITTQSLGQVSHAKRGNIKPTFSSPNSYLDEGIQARVSENLEGEEVKENERLHTQIKAISDRPYPYMSQIASDHIALLDNAKTARYIGEYNPEEVKDKYTPGQIAVQFETYGKTCKNPKINPFGTENDEDLPLLLQQLHRPGMRAYIEEDLGIKFKEIPLQVQIHLLRFMQDKDTETFDRFRSALQAHPEARSEIITTFLACAQNREYGNVILKLIETHPAQAERIFKQFAEIIGIFQEEQEKLKSTLEQEEALGSNVDTDKLYKSVTKRGIELLKSYAKSADSITDADAFLEQAEEYKREVVAFGAMFSAISKKAGQPVAPETINRISENIRVETLRGGDLLLSTDTEAMQNPENYLQPEKFNHQNYEMIVRNLEKAYKEIDPGWLRHLIDNIPKDLSSPSTTFLLIKNEKNELVGVIKHKKVEEGKYYFGTMYVEKAYQKGFGIGQYLDAYMKQDLPIDAQMEGTVAAANPAIARHIDAVGYIGNRITTEGSDEKKSKALINLDLNPQHEFKTKNKEEFTEQRIKGLHDNEYQSESIKILKLDTSSANVENYTKELEKWFNQGYQLTRFFYEDGKTPANTFLVLEKTENQKMKEPSLAA